MGKIQKAIFAAGCFWGVQSEFDQLDGVVKTTVGYTGGDFENPTYEDVSGGKTGHAEAIFIEYDPEKISYKDLLNKFWEIHDPTQMNRQGSDIGSNYRSAIFFTDENQKKTALVLLKNMEKSGKFKEKIVTEVAPEQKFYPAEEYHQKYFEKTDKKACHI